MEEILQLDLHGSQFEERVTSFGMESDKQVNTWTGVEIRTLRNRFVSGGSRVRFPSVAFWIKEGGWRRA